MTPGSRRASKGRHGVAQLTLTGVAVWVCNRDMENNSGWKIYKSFLNRQWAAWDTVRDWRSLNVRWFDTEQQAIDYVNGKVANA